MARYIKDPNDSTKQVPGALPDNAYDSVNNPSRCIGTKTPSYVLVNTLLTKPVAFFFGPTGSLTTANLSSFYTKMGDDLPAGTRLDIHPTAWSGSVADDSKISFVYKSGLSTGGR